MPPHVTAPSAPVPVPRAALFAVVGAVLGMSAHRSAAEGPVPWAQGGTAAVVLFGLGLVGARRPRRPATVVVCCVVAQYALHLWLTLTAGGGQPAEAADSRHGAHLHGHPAGRSPWPHDSLAMTVAHALAAVLVAVLLHRADSACWTLTHGVTAALHALRTRLTAVRRLVAGCPAASRAPGLPLVGAPGDDGLPPAGPVLAHAVTRRGPPPGAHPSRPPTPPGRRSGIAVRPPRPFPAWRHACPAPPCRAPRGA
ncbi:hypothetical protein ACH4F6_14215 [Streptomyces sp. NPDC017936]|uniref:hypothetical protein n=1 Tax=Streptomyces sp. NPDC017936 TaxID=3365016 RepID=UPI0037A6BE46